MTEIDLSRLSPLASALLEAKAQENEAKSRRVEIEEHIASLIETSESGQKTVAIGDGTKITVKRGLNYKADCEVIERLMTNPEFPPPVKMKTTRELDAKGYEWYRENHPDVFSIMSNHVTVTPKKVAVTIKEAKK